MLRRLTPIRPARSVWVSRVLARDRPLPVPTSFLQLAVPRPELHLLYNLAVFVPMIVAMWLHTRPKQASVNACTCAAPPIRMQQPV